MTTQIQDALARTVRLATDTDIDAIARLSESTTAAVRKLQSGGDFLVLDGPGDGLAGSIYLAIEESRARIGMLAVAPEFSDSPLADRLVAVAELMCEASGCEEVVHQ